MKRCSFTSTVDPGPNWSETYQRQRQYHRQHHTTNLIGSPAAHEEKVLNVSWQERQGWYGENFVRALAAAAGLQVDKFGWDQNGADLRIGSLAETEVVAFPDINAQVKSWCRPQGSTTHWHYRGLTEPQFNKLAATNYRSPRILVLVIVPEDPATYADADTERLVLSHAAYWISLQGRKRIKDPSSDRKVLVEIPKRQLLTASTLPELVAELGEEVA